MKKITLEKVLWFVGRLIRAVFLIAWNLTRVTVVLFLALLAGAPEQVPYRTSYWNYRRHWDDY